MLPAPKNPIAPPSKPAATGGSPNTLAPAKKGAANTAPTANRVGIPFGFVTASPTGV